MELERKFNVFSTPQLAACLLIPSKTILNLATAYEKFQALEYTLFPNLLKKPVSELSSKTGGNNKDASSRTRPSALDSIFVEMDFAVSNDEHTSDHSNLKFGT